ncbi:MAG: LysM peptidoglycan-binding domain-containing protein [Planctomycetota bacterium]
MTRESKIGLLIGLMIIVLVAVVVSDYVAEHQRDPAANLLNDPATTASPTVRSTVPAASTPVAERSATVDDAPRFAQGPIPTPEEIDRALREKRAAEAMARAAVERMERPIDAAPGRAMVDAVTQDGRLASAADAWSVERVASVPLLSTVDPVESAVIRTPEELSRDAQEARGAVAEPLVMPRPAPAAAPIDDAIVHRVEAGENLFEIARRYLNDGNAWPRIARANPDLVTPQGHVVEGARLVIPSLRGDTATDATRLAERTAPRPRTVTVEEGDSLARIARRHLGSPDRWRDLLEANRGVIDRPEHIRPGQTLVLPSETDTASTTPTASTSSRDVNSAAAFGGVRTVTVKDGDTLSSIAQATLGSQSRWPELFEANRRVLANPDAVRPGQTLRLP